MSLFLSTIVLIANVILGFLVIIKSKHKSANRVFSFLIFSSSFWIFSNIMVDISKNEFWLLFWSRLTILGALLMPIFFWKFSLIYPDETLYKNNKIYKKIELAIWFIFTVFLTFVWSDLNVYHVSVEKYGPPTVDTGSLYIFLFIYLMALVIHGIVNLFIVFKQNFGLRRNQVLYVIIGISLTFILAVITNLILLILNYSELAYMGPLFTIFLIGFTTYSIVKYRLMNIRVILTRSILYTFLVVLVATFFAVSVLLAGRYLGADTKTSNVVVYLVASAIIVLFLDPVKRVFARFTDKIFYKDKIDYQQVLQQVASVLASEIDLQKLLQNLVMRLTALLKIKKVSVWVPTNDHFSMIAFAGAEKKAEVSKKFTDFIVKKNKLIVIEDLLRSKEGAVNTSEQQELENFLQEAEANKIELIIPVIEENKISALIFCGSKQSGDFYSGEEINFFELLMPQVATAVRKSQLYEDLQELNVSLQSKVEERTKSLQEANDGLIERNKFLTTMQVVTGLISHNLDIKKVNQQITDSIASELGYVGGLLIFADFKENVLKLEAITQSPLIKKILPLLPMDPFAYKSPIQEGYNLGMQTFLSGKINFTEKIADVLHPPVPSIVLDQIQKILGVKTVVCIPIFSEAKIIGIIHFFLKKTQSTISSLDIETMTALTNQVGIVYSNLQLYNTLQKANRDLQEANMHLRDLDKAKSEFLSIASHQLRTPISAIKGYLSMILDGDFGKINNPKVNEVMKGIFESSTRLARLVNIFLNVSRIESGRLKLEKRPTQVNDLITSVISELIGEAKKKGLKLSYQENKNLPLINIDPDKIRDVILNLIDNSIKYTPKGSVKVSVSSDDKFIKFVVNDTGIGIDPVEAKGLFRKFVRGSGVAQIHTGGSGLGLFIAQKMIKEHGGRVWAESEGKEKGSTFQFVIPFNDEDRLVENT